MAKTKLSARPIFIFATVVTALTVTMGGLVCATESGLACPTWPGCHVGQVIPGLHLPGWIEFSHRMVSALCLISLVWAGLTVWKSHKHEPWIRWLPWAAVLGAIAAAILGMSIIFWGISQVLAAFDLMCSLFALVAITFATVAFLQGRFDWRWTPASIWGFIALVSLMLMHAMGVLVAGHQSFTRCLGWPVLTIISDDRWAWLQIARFTVAAMVLAGVLFVAFALPRLRGISLGITAMVLVQFGLGFVLVTNSPLWLRGVYSVIAGFIFAVVAYISANAGLVHEPDDEGSPARREA